jgi:hypothetical protein
MTSLHTYAKFAYVRFTDDLSRRLTIGAYSEYVSVSYSGANGYAGQLASFDAQGNYPLFERKLVPMVGVSFGTYRPNQSVNVRQDLFAGTVGVVARPVSQFSIDTQVQLLRNPVAENDVRFFAKINYWFHTNLNIIADAGR